MPPVQPVIQPTINVEFYAFKIKYEDDTLPPAHFFSELVQTDVINCWDVEMPVPGSIIKNIINKSLKNSQGASMLTGVLVEATHINGAIEIIDITGKIENAELKFSDQNDEIEIEEPTANEQGTPKLIFKFKRWRMGILPEKGIVVIERRSTGYDKKLAEFMNSWSMKWSQRDATRRYKSIKIEPLLTGTAPSDFLSFGSVGFLEFAISSEVLSDDSNNIFSSDLRDMLKNDKNLVVSIEVKAKKGQAFLPEVTSEFIELIRTYENVIQKCTSKKVVGGRKSKPVNLINNLHSKVCTVQEDTDALVLSVVESYLVELNDDE